MGRRSITHNCTGVQVDAKMQELKAKGQAPFIVDTAFLALHRPSLVLTQDSCKACDVDSSLTAKVRLDLCSPTFVL